MRQTRLLMGMPITVEVVDDVSDTLIDEVFAYFDYVDRKFSVYKADSEISRINDRRQSLEQSSDDMRAIFALAEETRQQTFGFFDITRNGTIDPSGIVKGWAIFEAAEILRRHGCRNYYVDAGGDVQVGGVNSQGRCWRVGIRNPFDLHEIVKVLVLSDAGVATSGTSIRGQHIYNPHDDAGRPLDDVVSLTVVGPNIYEADRFATAAFAMGRSGVAFIEALPGLEGYQIDAKRRATFTSGFARFLGHA